MIQDVRNSVYVSKSSFSFKGSFMSSLGQFIPFLLLRTLECVKRNVLILESGKRKSSPKSYCVILYSQNNYINKKGWNKSRSSKRKVSGPSSNKQINKQKNPITLTPTTTTLSRRTQSLSSYK